MCEVSKSQEIQHKMEWNGAYHSEALVPDSQKVIHEQSTRENGRIRIRFRINVQDTEIGKFDFEQELEDQKQMMELKENITKLEDQNIELRELGLDCKAGQIIESED